MKNNKEIYKALLAGKTLINKTGYETLLDNNDNLTTPCTFSMPENWSIKSKLIEVFIFIDNEGRASGAFFTTKDEAVEYFKHREGKIIKLQQVTECSNE